MDFATTPPEINSGRMYSGAGSGPMLAAASVWKGLAAELRSTVLSYRAVLTHLLGEQWHGPASASMAAAAAPYIAWMNNTAAQAEQTGTQAEAALAAYEAAFAATVPPPTIAANRVQLMALIAGNVLGQNTPAIAATEAQYTEMWAQDAAAMYEYAGSSAAAIRLTPFTQPAQTVDPGGLTAQSASAARAAATPAGTAQATLAQVISALPNALQSLASPALPGPGLSGALDNLGLEIFAPGSGSSISGLAGLLNTLSGSNSAFGALLNANLWNTIFSSGFYMPGNWMGTATDLLGLSGQAAGQAAGDIANGASDAAATPLLEIERVGDALSAGLGRSSTIGALSVPPSWTAPAPLHSPLSGTLGATPMTAPPPAVAAGMPGVPLSHLAGQGLGRAIPQYGFRPTFVPRPPAAG